MLPLAACIVGRSEFTPSVFYQPFHCFDSFLIYLVNSWRGRKKKRVFTLCKWWGGGCYCNLSEAHHGRRLDLVILPSCKLLLGYSALSSAAQCLQRILIHSVALCDVYKASFNKTSSTSMFPLTGHRRSVGYFEQYKDAAVFVRLSPGVLCTNVY